MIISILLSNYDQTGMTTNTFDLCEGLLKFGHTVNLIMGKRNIESVPLSKFEQNYPFLKGQENFKLIQFKLDETNILTKFVSTLKIVFYLIKSKADIIHVESPYLSFIPWLIRKKFVSTMHVTDIQPNFYYKKATQLIAISKETHEYAIDVHNYPPIQ